MKYEDVLTLARAGFTAADIAGFATMEQEPAPTETAKEKEGQVDPSAGKPAGDADAAVSARENIKIDQLITALGKMGTVDESDYFATIKEQLSDIKQAVQAQNVRDIQAPAPARPQSMRDIMEGIINPEKHKE